MTPGQIASTVICAFILGLAVWVVYVIRTDTDDHTEQLADHEQQLGNLHLLVAEHLGLEMDDPDTDEIPAQPQTEPTPLVLPETVPMARAWDDALRDLPRPTPFPRTTAPGRHRAP